MLSWFFRPPGLESESLNPFALAARSRHAAIEAVDQSKEALARAEARLADAQNTYIDEDDWNDQRVLAKAEEAYEDALAEWESAEIKRAWEDRGEWKRSFPRTAAVIERTKQLLAKIDWPAIRPLNLL